MPDSSLRGEGGPSPVDSDMASSFSCSSASLASCSQPVTHSVNNAGKIRNFF